ncbi:MAG: NUDIX domain-containing protein [Deltaproteobacteria bacterium]
MAAHALGVAVDVVIFTVIDGTLRVLLTKRPASHATYPDSWSLPGGFVAARESAEAAAERELAAKAGVEGVYLEQLYTFSDPDRDPRNRVVSIAYYALVSPDRLTSERGSHEPDWFDVGDTPKLAFDHDTILRVAVERIRGKLDYTPICFQLLPARFTLTELQKVYEAVLDEPLDKRNFRSRVLKSGLVAETDAFRTGNHRPAKLYEFVRREGDQAPYGPSPGVFSRAG